MNISGRVYIGRLHFSTRDRDLEKFFKGYGRIREITLKNGYGFVEFEDPRDADDAVFDLNGKSLCGERVVVEHSRPNPGGSRGVGGGGGGGMYGMYGGPPPRRGGGSERSVPPLRTSYRVLVENLSSRVVWQDLKEFLGKVAEVTFADAHKRKKGHGVAEFATRGDMKNAITKLNGTELKGRKIVLLEDREDSSKRRRSSSSRRRSRSRSHRRDSRSRSRSDSRSRRRKDSRSPRRRDSRSRSKDSRSPRKDSRSPRKDSRSPRRDSRDSRKRDSRSPRKDSRSPRKDSRSPKRDSRNSRRKDSRSPRKSRSPRRDSRSPKRDSRDSRKESRDSRKNDRSPVKRDSRSPAEKRDSRKRASNGDSKGRSPPAKRGRSSSASPKRNNDGMRDRRSHSPDDARRSKSVSQERSADEKKNGTDDD